MTSFKGTVFYASKNAKQKKYMVEGSKVNIHDFYHAVRLGEYAVQIDFDSTGTNYIHLITNHPV